MRRCSEQGEASSGWDGVEGKAAELCSELVLCMLPAAGSGAGPGQHRAGCSVDGSSRAAVF